MHDTCYIVGHPQHAADHLFLTSNKVMSAGPVMFHTTPVAFSIPMSRRGEEMAPWAA